MDVVFAHLHSRIVLYTLFSSPYLYCNVPSIHIICDCIQARNQVDDVREDIKESFGNLKLEMMVGAGLLLCRK